MRKILINGRYLTQQVTGVQRYANQMVTALVENCKNQYQITLAVPKGTEVPSINGLNIYNDDSFLTGHVWEQIRLPIIYKKLITNLLWSPCNTGPFSIRNQIITIHDAAVFAEPRWFTWKFAIFYKTLLPLLGKIAKQIVTDSEFSKKELTRYGVTRLEKISVVRSGIDHFKYFDQKENNLEICTPYILYLGSTNPRKNLTRLCQAWSLVPKEIKAGTVLAIGGITDKVFNQKSQELSGEDLKLLGRVPDSLLPDLYKKATAFVYPSLYEGFGLPPLEAMSYGIPVLVSNTSSMPEICGDAAIYCDPLDVQDIRSKIIRILTDDNLKTFLRQKGYARCAQFKWDYAAKHLLKIFDQLLCSVKN